MSLMRISVVNTRRAFAYEISRWISPEFNLYRVLQRRINAYALPCGLGQSLRYSCFRIWYCFLEPLKCAIISSAYLTVTRNDKDSQMSWISSCRPWESQGIIKVYWKEGRACKRRTVFSIMSQIFIEMELIRYSCPFIIARACWLIFSA
jgi:hypothetical protein